MTGLCKTRAEKLSSTNCRTVVFVIYYFVLLRKLVGFGAMGRSGLFRVILRESLAGKVFSSSSSNATSSLRFFNSDLVSPGTTTLIVGRMAQKCSRSTVHMETRYSRELLAGNQRSTVVPTPNSLLTLT